MTLRALRCWLTWGHRCNPTGLKGLMLQQHRCQDCGGLFVSHRHHGDMLLPSDAEFEVLMRGEIELCHRSAKERQKADR